MRESDSHYGHPEVQFAPVAAAVVYHALTLQRRRF